MLRKGLNSLGVANDFFEIKHESRSNYVILDEKNQRHIKVNEPGPVIDEGELAAFVEWVSHTAQEGDYWVFCGSLPLEYPTDLCRINKGCESKGARACLDSSGEALRLGIEAQPYW
jgi:1-phosphofructokinase